MSSPSSSRSSTSSIPRGSPRTKMNKHAIEKEETTASLGAADPITSDGSQPSLSSRYLDMLVKVDKTPFIRNLFASFFT